MSTVSIETEAAIRKAQTIPYYIWDLVYSVVENGPFVSWILISYLTETRHETLFHAVIAVNLFDASPKIMSVLATLLMKPLPCSLYFRALFSAITCAMGLSLLWSLVVFGSDDLQDKVFYPALFFFAWGIACTRVTFQPFHDEQRNHYLQAKEVHGDIVPGWEMKIFHRIGQALLLTRFVVLPFVSSQGILLGVPSLMMIFVSFKLIKGYKTVFIHDEAVHEQKLKDDEPEIEEEDTEKGQNLKEDEPEIEEESTSKGIIRIMPIWITFLMPALIACIWRTYFPLQSGTMNPNQSFLRGPSLFICLAQYLKYIEEYLYSTHDPVKVMAKSGVLSIIGCVLSALVEVKRIHEVKKHGSEEPLPMNMLVWMFLPLTLLGYATEASEMAVKKFFHDQLPEKLQRYAGLFVDATTGGGTLLGVLTMYVAQMYSDSEGDKKGWFGTTMATTRLDYFYWILAILCTLNFLLLKLILGVYDYRRKEHYD